jgi:ubiquinone/menaquinone biosynthesis C-methylase UbiE
MTVQLDPEERETQALLKIAGDFTGQRVLEIGCGDGRLTRRYAEQAGFVEAIDPDSERIDRARQEQPVSLQKRVVFHHAGLDAFYAQHTRKPKFDMALLAWSL